MAGRKGVLILDRFVLLTSLIDEEPKRLKKADTWTSL
jgi:hypothetical protein